MRIHLIKKITLEQFSIKHSGSKNSLENWYNIISYADWHIPEDILKTYGSVDLLGNGTERVVFNIGGNNYRMICKYWFGTKAVHLYVKWIGTHAEYTRLCKSKQQFTINDY